VDVDEDVDVDVDVDIDEAIKMSVFDVVDKQFATIDKLSVTYFTKELKIMDHFTLLHSFMCGSGLYLSEFTHKLHLGLMSASHYVDWRSLSNIKGAHIAASINTMMEDSEHSNLFSYDVDLEKMDEGLDSTQFRDAFDPNFLNFLSADYAAPWPASSILLNFDAMRKYNVVQKHLMKHFRVCFLMKDLFQTLKFKHSDSRNSGSEKGSLHKLDLLRHEAQHVLSSIGHYYSIKVTECWGEFERGMGMVQGVNDFCRLYDRYLDSIGLIFFQHPSNNASDSINRSIVLVRADIDKFYHHCCTFCNLIVQRAESSMSSTFLATVDIEKKKLDMAVQDLRVHLQLDIMSLSSVRNKHFKYMCGCSNLLGGFLM